MSIGTTLAGAAAKAKVGLIKASPTIAVVGGVGMLIGAAVVVGKQSIKAKETYDQAKEYIIEAENSFAEDRVYEDKITGQIVPYTYADYTKDVRTITIQTVLKLLKIYRWAIVLTVGGATAIFWSYFTMNKALIGANLALQTLSTKYDRLYQFAIKEHGEAKIQDIVDGVKVVKTERHKDPETGKMITNNTYAVPDGVPSNWIIWGPGDSGWEREESYREAYLRKVQQHMTDSLCVKDIVWLSEVIDMFGKHDLEEQEEEFRVTGWIGPNSKQFDPDIMDGYVKITKRVLDDDRWLLTFNTDGVILPYLPKKNKRLDWGLGNKYIAMEALQEA